MGKGEDLKPVHTRNASFMNRVRATSQSSYDVRTSRRHRDGNPRQLALSIVRALVVPGESTSVDEVVHTPAIPPQPRIELTDASDVNNLNDETIHTVTAIVTPTPSAC
ncbi:MAG: hypothetical protein ACOC5K_03360 [Chloroflexota bacterium]